MYNFIFNAIKICFIHPVRIVMLILSNITFYLSSVMDSRIDRVRNKPKSLEIFGDSWLVNYKYLLLGRQSLRKSISPHVQYSARRCGLS